MMSSDAKADWEKFRGLMPKHCRVRQQWAVSYEAFVEKFPTSESRDNIIEFSEEVIRTFNHHQAIFDAMRARTR